MNRWLKLAMLLGLILGGSQVGAVELGQIQPHSALGQPLVADIPIRSNNPADLRNLSARLASAEAFARAGINGPGALLQFNIAGSGNSHWIRITSSAPISEPYLDLLIEVSNASGSSTHEYTLLLDPPGSQVAAPVVAMPSSIAPGRPAHTATAITPDQVDQPATRNSAPRVAADSKFDRDRYGPVERGQTLTAIARITATPGVNLNQMLLALKEANPEAFYRDNINTLKAGAILRVPTHADAQSVTNAAAQVRRQYDDWRNHGGAHAPTAVAAAATHADSAISPTANGPADDRLSLVPTQQGGQNAAKAAQQELQRSRETLTALQQQSAELQSRVKDLEDINGKNQRLLSLKDNEIAELQKKLAETRKVGVLPMPVNAPAVAATIAKPATAPMAPAAMPAVVAPAKVRPPAHAATAAPVASPVVIAAKPAVVPSIAAKSTAATSKLKPSKPLTAAEPTWYRQPWAWLIALAAIILLLFGLRRGRENAAQAALAMRPLGATDVNQADIGRADFDRADFNRTEVDQADVDQEELLDQLAEHPDNIGLHLELVSLYYRLRDVEHFEAAAEAMHAHITGPAQPEWQNVLRMGEDLVPEHPLFADEAGEPSSLDPHDERGARRPFDLDHYNATPTQRELPPLAGTSDLYEFDRVPDNAPLPSHAESKPRPIGASEPESRWQFDEPVAPAFTGAIDQDPTRPSRSRHGELDHADLNHIDLDRADGLHAQATNVRESAIDSFSDDPSDTKLDLARAYLDMGDPDGARAMLEEVLKEGSQIQRDVARRLLDGLH